MPLGKLKAVGNMHVLWLVKLMLSISNLFLHLVEITRFKKTSLGESYILPIYGHLDAKEKHSLNFEGIYNM